ncbi:cytochrome C oxidase subunit III [Wolbachia pipientis]|uniref:cytochrome-c oxidase n=1 Tax=Wolbachia pipientis TaxID=955 RepID=A0A1E7QJA8_WOLPI|nr:cytochrome c oxidase subunit 3 [Wolbachia pipientis]OEY86545.1 cytochrome C oxidase subunit III [Wolbachia pipientis]
MASSEHYSLEHLSPWPIALSAAVLILILGIVSIITDQFFGVPILALGVITLLWTLFCWWKDVIAEAKLYTYALKHGLKIAMYLFIFSEIIFFAAFFCSFFKAWLDPVFILEAFTPTKKVQWPPEGVFPPDPWSLPFMNTLILLLSGTAITGAHHYLRENDMKNTANMLLITISLGVFFIIVQAIEYYEANFSLKETGNKLIYISHFYMITGVHCMHVIIGVVFLVICWLRTLRGHFTSQNHLCFEFASWYWHFVDIVWLFLFIFVYWLSI